MGVVVVVVDVVDGVGFGVTANEKITWLHIFLFEQFVAEIKVHIFIENLTDTYG